MAGGSGETGYARKGDTSIAFRVVGDGPLDLVFGAGFACHLDLLRGDPHCDAFVRRLSRLGRLVLFDKPGTGLSDPLTAPPTLADRMEDHLAVMDAVGMSRALVVAFSEAAPPGLLLAATHPERVEGLVSLSGPVRFTCDVDYLPHLEEYLEGYIWAQMWHSYENWGDGSFVQALSPFVRGSAVYRRLAPTMERATASPAMARTIIQSLRRYDARSAAAAVRVPTLVVNREQEWVPADVARDLAERISGSRLALLPGDEHLCYIDGSDILQQIEAFVGGRSPRGSSRPEARALLTLLFTDIVGSTGAAAERGDDAWRSVLAQHDARAADLVERIGGRVVKSLGDGMLAVFDRPALALQAALALHTAATDLDLQLRAGLHTGECELVGEDVAGIAVHIAARVAALAPPGETLATTTVRDLVLGSLTSWSDRGEHVLKGVPGRWRLVAAGPGRSPFVPQEPRNAMRPHDRALMSAAGRAPVMTRAALRWFGRLRSRAADPSPPPVRRPPAPVP